MPKHVKPEHPFYYPDSPESTRRAIDGVLAMLQQYAMGGEEASFNDRLAFHGLFVVLEGVRGAVWELEGMEAVPRYTKPLEVGK